MTTVDPPSLTAGRETVQPRESWSKWLTAAGATAPLLAAGAYAALVTSYGEFYRQLGTSPGAVGLAPGDVLAEAAVPVLLAAVAAAAYIAPVAYLYLVAIRALFGSPRRLPHRDPELGMLVLLILACLGDETWLHSDTVVPSVVATGGLVLLIPPLVTLVWVGVRDRDSVEPHGRLLSLSEFGLVTLVIVVGYLAYALVNVNRQLDHVVSEVRSGQLPSAIAAAGESVPDPLGGRDLRSELPLNMAVATIIPSKDATRAAPVSCGFYLGSSDGDAVIFVPSGEYTIRIPLSTYTLRLYPRRHQCTDTAAGYFAAFEPLWRQLRTESAEVDGDLRRAPLPPDASWPPTGKLIGDHLRRLSALLAQMSSLDPPASLRAAHRGYVTAMGLAITALKQLVPAFRHRNERAALRAVRNIAAVDTREESLVIDWRIAALDATHRLGVSAPKWVATVGRTHPQK